jgi:hypothetical protein
VARSWIEARVVTYEVIMKKNDEAWYTVYVVECHTPDGRSWTIKKRYSEFSEMYARIKAEVRGVSFPGKSFGKLRIDQQEKRRLHLHAFMTEVTSRHDLSVSSVQAVLDFCKQE